MSTLILLNAWNFLLLAFCFLLVSMVDQKHKCAPPSPYQIRTISLGIHIWYWDASIRGELEASPELGTRLGGPRGEGTSIWKRGPQTIRPLFIKSCDKCSQVFQKKLNVASFSSAIFSNIHVLDVCLWC